MSTHEVVKTRDIDIARDVPQVVFSELDAGAYLTAGVLLARHPETGAYNASWNRAQLVGGDHMRVRMMPPQHLGRYHAEAESRGQSLPVAIVVGAPPGLMLSGASKVPYEAVSNWGAYGVAACLAAGLGDEDLFHTGADERRLIEACVAAGAIDPVGAQLRTWVDGTDATANAAMVDLLRSVVVLGARPPRDVERYRASWDRKETPP